MYGEEPNPPEWLVFFLAGACATGVVFTILAFAAMFALIGEH